MLPKSVFTKLFLVMVTTGLILIFFVLLFFGVTFKKRHTLVLKTTIAPYINYIIDNLGTPPDYKAAKQLADLTGIDIRYTGNGPGWETSTRPLSIPKKSHVIYSGDLKILVGSFPGRHVYIVKRGSDTFFVRLKRPPFNHNRLFVLFGILLVFLSLTIIGSYLAVKRILRPVALLKKGVDEVSGGNLAHSININGKDELADLASAFNGMIERVRTMISDRERLLTDVSHELRSPVGRIKVALELIQDSSAKERIREDLYEMEAMITELLETARIKHQGTSPEFTTTDIVQLVGDIINSMQDQGPGIDYGSPCQTPVLAEVMPESLKTAIRNILSNALRYSRESEKPVVVSLSQDQEYVKLSISDSGPGIPPQERNSVFEPFYRIDESRSRISGGYGLGLSLSKTIIDAHNGSIRITDSPGGGAQFNICLKKQQEDEFAKTEK